MPERPSLLKLLANRRNAKKCTGPKTPEGKRRAARNAVRHSLYAKNLTLATRAELRDESRFDDFARSLSESLQPRDDFELLLVTRIIRSAWRMRQLLRLEPRCWRENPLASASDCGSALLLLIRHENRASRDFHGALDALHRYRSSGHRMSGARGSEQTWRP